jgi:hypothetical protein
MKEVFTLGFCAILIWFIASSIRVGMAPVRDWAGLVSYVNRLVPYIITTISISIFLTVQVGTQLLFTTLKRPVSSIDEFRADLIAYLELGKVEPFSSSLATMRRYQVAYQVKQQVEKGFERQFTARIRALYRRAWKRGIYSKQYRSWMDYFRTSYGNLLVTLGRGFDYPNDELRIEFLRFIERVCKAQIRLECNAAKRVVEWTPVFENVF